MREWIQGEEDREGELGERIERFLSDWDTGYAEGDQRKEALDISGGGGGNRKIKRGTERGNVYGMEATIPKPYLMAASKILLPTLSCTLATVSLKKQKYDS